jgi:hypothetical protein
MTVTLLHGDCLEQMAAMADGCVDAIVTDPPAGISFMGRHWDGDKGGRDQWIAWMRSVAAEALRVAKPGAHALVWALPRTSHWTATAWENAGWEVRDRCSHIFGSGFPKSLNVSKALAEKGACSCRVRGSPCPDGNDLSYLRQSAETKSVSVLQPEMCGGGEAAGSAVSAEGLRPLQQGMDTAKPGTVTAKQNMFRGMQGGGPFTAGQRKAAAAKKEPAADRQDLCGLRGGVDAEGSLSGGAQPDVFAGMQRQAHLGAEGGEADRGEGGAAGDAVRTLRDHSSGASETCCSQRGDILQPVMSGEGVCGSSDTPLRQHEGAQAEGPEVRHGQSRLEGRGDVPEQARELRVGSLCEVPAGTAEHGAEGRLRDGAPASNGAVGRARIAADGMCSSRGPQSTEQQSDELGAMAGQPQSQAGGAWPLCGRCGKPIVPDGLGTSLKPAMEDWWLLRKPLIGTVAANVLAHGTGALNIDACRVNPGEFTKSGGRSVRGNGGVYGDGIAPTAFEPHNAGRWPANVITDGSDEVLEAFAAFGSSKSKSGGKAGATVLGVMNDDAWKPRETARGGHDDEGSPARFFYAAKASRAERNQSKHPTQKPLALMRYLCKLITPPGGTVLDMFAGSGTTLLAAQLEGFDAVGIEQDAAYVADARRRLGITFQLEAAD